MSRTRPRAPTGALLFDGGCGICTAFASFARRVDRRGRFEILPYQNLDEAALRPYGIGREECEERLYVLTPWPSPPGLAPAPGRAGPRSTSLRARGGAAGLNAFFFAIFPWTLLVLLLYLLPVLWLLEILVYRWVARHRAAISERLGLRGCRI